MLELSGLEEVFRASGLPLKVYYEVYIEHPPQELLFWWAFEP